MQTPNIPYDIYESPQEVVIILPLGSVKKESVEVKIADYRILIKGTREKPKLKSSCLPVQEECYR
ncbi:MAG: Hsp20/alpha crystallin family protein [Candidatus Peribacteria bacterium]|jgi:HSP20 family molecular chaperone IbpA|nr:Hsp20/alpha crystallin family protein [Candidatus Peribacteria bacterium]